jgi:hypothetical protein
MDSPPTGDGIKKRKNALSSCNAFFILGDRLGISSLFLMRKRIGVRGIFIISSN